LDNRAVFEVPEVFARLLARALGSAAGQAELDHLVRCAVATGD
jgi:hypothetical protein